MVGIFVHNVDRARGCPGQRDHVSQRQCSHRSEHQETTLTPANVNFNTFGKIFTAAVDGEVYAQALIMPNVSIGGGTHTVLYAATEHDSVYAIDADTGVIYWRKSLIPAGGSTVSSGADLNCGDVATEVGITGTPVIDPAGGTLYVVAKVKLAGVIAQHLHALDLTTGAEKFGGPNTIAASVPGTASDGNGGIVTFNPTQENQRTALLLENGHVIVAWTAHCDKTPWHGWVMSYGATTLTLEGTYNASANGYGNGIWMSGGGPAADPAGNVFFATGNGSWNSTDLGESVVKLGAPSGSTLPVLDYFTTYDQSALTLADHDLSAGGLILLPTLANGQQLLVIMGKDGNIYLLNRANLGKYCITQTPACTTGNPQIVQEIDGALTASGAPPRIGMEIFTSPAATTTRSPPNRSKLTRSTPAARSRRHRRPSPRAASPSRVPCHPSPRTATPTRFSGASTMARCAKPAQRAQAARRSMPTTPPI